MSNIETGAKKLDKTVSVRFEYHQTSRAVAIIPVSNERILTAPWKRLFANKRHITKTCLYMYNADPLKPHFYIVKLGFTGVYIIILISAQKHRLWLLVRTASPRRF